MGEQVAIEVRAVWDEQGEPQVQLETRKGAVAMNTAVARQLAAMLLNAADDLDDLDDLP
jgi:hypothetical protein